MATVNRIKAAAEALKANGDLSAFSLYELAFARGVVATENAATAHRAQIARQAEERAKPAQNPMREGLKRLAEHGRAAAELARLTPEQQAAVTKIAGGDPTRILSTVEAVKSTWATSSEPNPTEQK